MLGPCRRGLTALILIACVGCPDSSEAERQAELSRNISELSKLQAASGAAPAPAAAARSRP